MSGLLLLAQRKERSHKLPRDGQRPVRMLLIVNCGRALVPEHLLGRQARHPTHLLIGDHSVASRMLGLSAIDRD